MTARLCSLDGFTPGADRLCFGVDLYYAEADRWRKLCYDGGGNNHLVVVKLTEGQHPETRRDKRLADDTYKGALDIVEVAIKSGIPWSCYHYATPGRDGGTPVDDAKLEARWFLDQLAEFESDVAALHTDETIERMLEMLPNVPEESDTHRALTAAIRRLTAHCSRVWLDVEDKSTRLDSRGLERWCHDWLDEVGGDLGYNPALYTYTSYAKRFPKGHTLGEYPLVQAQYGNNRPDRLLESPELPHGWDSRAGWQFTSRYRQGLDRNVFRLSALAIPRDAP